MHEQDEATQTQNILRCRRHCQAHMQHLHTQKETVVTIRSHANEFSADARQVETVLDKIQRGVHK